MRYLLGVDFGGGSSKATVLDETGTVVATTAEEYPMIYPSAGWAEQDVEALYQAFLTNVKAVLAKAAVPPEDIVAMAVDGATHIAVLLDEDLKPIRPAIHWTDSRSWEEAGDLQVYKDEFLEHCYNSPSVAWTLPQLIWLRKHELENYARIHKIIYLKDYIRHRVTGDLFTDFIEIQGSLFYDELAGDYSDRYLALAGLTREQMPELKAPGDIAGTPLPAFCEATGLSPNMVVAVGATDTVMEIFAAGSAALGNTTIKLATAGRICPITDKAYPDPNLFTYRHIIPGYWYPGTGTKSCAYSLRWYRDALSPFEMEEAERTGRSAFDLIGDAAATVPAGSDRLFFHPYLQGEATPYQNPKLRASFTGVSSYHTKAHFNRAVMEGVAYSLKDCMQVLEGLEIPMDETFRIIGGGSKSALWRQIVSDVLDRPLRRVRSDDSSIGSAMLAGVVSGVFGSWIEAVEVCSQMEDVVYPNKENRAVYEENFAIYKEIQQAMEKIYSHW